MLMPSASRLKDDTIAMDANHDANLLQAIADRRDREAFTELCERYRDRVFNLAFSILRDSTAAEDAAQDVLLQVWLSAKTFQAERGSPANWILGMATNQSYKSMLSRKRRARREEQTAAERARTVTSGDKLEDRETLNALRAQLASLTDVERTLLAGFYGAGMSHQKIADMTGMPRRTVSDKIAQSLERLRGGLGGAGIAAVVPVLSAETMFSAITSGRPCPAGLTQKTLQSLQASSGRAAKSFSRRLPLAKSGFGAWWLAAAGVVVCAGTAIAVLTGTPAPVSKIQPATPAAATAVAKKLPESIDLKWQFAEVLPKDFVSVQGGGDMVQKNSIHGIKITSKVDGGFFIQHPVPHHPMRLTILSRVDPGVTARVGCFWRQGLRVMDCRVKQGVVDVNVTEVSRTDFYIVDRYIFGWSNGKINSVVEYTEDFPGDALCVTLSRGGVFESISLKSISLDEVPAGLKDVDRVIASIALPFQERPGATYFENTEPKPER